MFAPCPDVGGEPASDKNSKMLILDLLCTCVRSHTYRFKYFALRNNLCIKVCVRVGVGWGGKGADALPYFMVLS
jgi:hypothetical protein